MAPSCPSSASATPKKLLGKRESVFELWLGLGGDQGRLVWIGFWVHAYFHHELEVSNHKNEIRLNALSLRLLSVLAEALHK